jgi:peptide/nickel transport system substrate-binding protein
MTIISHVEPFDLGNFAKPDYYWNYQMLAADAANGFLFQPQFPTIAKKNVKGLWKELPIFANDLSALSWG